MLHDMIGKIRNKEEIPTGWKEEYLVKHPKKGAVQECKNYGGIIFLSVPGKLINRVILGRLKTDSEATRQASVKIDHAGGEVGPLPWPYHWWLVREVGPLPWSYH